MDQPEESEPKDLQTEENNDEMKAESIENCENEKISEDIEMSETATDTAVDNAEKKDIEEQSICENQEKYEENPEIQENPTENQIEGNENEEKMDKSEENSEKTPIAAKENTIEGTIIVGEKDDENDEAAEEDNDDDNEDEPKLEFHIGRTVTLQMLLAAKLLEPGKSAMTIEYLGQKFVGDLLPDGKIKSQETETIFCSPSAWAMHCKRIINPEKKSGCGWASVRFKGKKLDAIKTRYLRQRDQLQKDMSDDGEADPESKQDLPESEIKRIVLPFNTVNNRNIQHDPNTLVETVSFVSQNKLQPFLVSITTSSVLLMDFHCHLTKQEVCGYLGGSWDNNTHTLAITHAFPVRNTRHDRHFAIEVEQHIQRDMLKKNLILVGWYHSHPRMAAQPTLRDCDAQLEHQIKMRGISDATYTPCIGLICSPYYTGNPTLESSITAYWVVPPIESRPMEYGRPMSMQFSVTQDVEMSEHVKSEMVYAIEYYRQFENEMVKFDGKYGEESSLIEKLKTTLYSKFPREQNDFEFWNWLRQHLGLPPEDEFTPPKWTSRDEREDTSETDTNAGRSEINTKILSTSIVESNDNKSETINLDPDTRESKDSDEPEIVEIKDGDGKSVKSDRTIENEATTKILSEAAMDIAHFGDSKDIKDEKLSIRSLQEQLKLPSGLNMTPSPISSIPLLQPPQQTKSSGNSNVSASNAPSSVSPRNSPIPTNLSQKFEIPPPATPSPAKSDASSTRNRNSPLPANLSKYSSSSYLNTPSSSSATMDAVKNLSKSGTTVTPNDPTMSATRAMEDFLAASISGGKIPGFSSSDYAALLQHAPSKDLNAAVANLMATGGSSSKSDKHSSALAAAAGLDSTTNMKDFLAQLEKSTELSYLLQQQYQYPSLSHLNQSAETTSNSQPSTPKSTKQSKRSSRSSSTTSQYEDNFKNEQNKINDYLRSQEYTKLLMEQAQALNIAHQGYGDLSSIVSAINTLPTNTSVTTSSRKSRKSSTVTQQSLTPQQPLAELTQLLHSGSNPSPAKINELLRQIDNSVQKQAQKSHLTYQQQQQQHMELIAQVQQQLNQAMKAEASKANKLQHQKQQKEQQQSQQNSADYMALLSQAKLPDLATLMAAQSYAGSGANMPSAAELSMLSMLGPQLGNLGGSQSGKAAEIASLNASIDMLGNLFSSGASNKNADLNSLLFPQSGKADLSNFLAAAGHQSLLSSAAPTSSQSSYSTKNSGSSHSFYSQSSQSALDKAQQDLIALYSANPITSSVTSGASKSYPPIPDPLSKSTLAANNMFMNPSIYAKLQQDALNAMIMKPPSKTSSKNDSKSRETSGSPASRNYNRDSPSTAQHSLSVIPSPSSTPSPSSAKHNNFSAVDLAVSSVGQRPSSRSSLIKSSLKGDDSNANHGIDPEALALATAQHYKKRMEFSIADLVSPPPSKMMKYADNLAASAHDLSKFMEDKEEVLNLSGASDK